MNKKGEYLHAANGLTAGKPSVDQGRGLSDHDSNGRVTDSRTAKGICSIRQFNNAVLHQSLTQGVFPGRRCLFQNLTQLFRNDLQKIFKIFKQKQKNESDRNMSWLTPSIIATAAGTALLSFVYFYLYFADRKKYLAIWAVSWAVYFLRFIFMLGLVMVPQTRLFLIGNQLSSLFSGLLLLWGTYQFIDKKMPGIWLFCSGIGAIWIILSISLRFEFLLMSIPTFTFLSIVYVWTGLTFLKSDIKKNIAKTAAGAGFILWGIHKVNYPFLRPIVWLAPWGYLLAAIIEFIIALGMLLVYFQEIREELKNEQNFLKKAQEIGQIGTWELNVKKNKLIWTDQNYKIFGVPPGTELTYELFLNRVHPDDRGYVDKKWKESLNNNLFDIEHRLLVDGKTKWVREKAELIFNEKDECLMATGVTQDITRNKRIESSLIESEEKFRLAFQTSPDAINLNRLDDGIYIDINEGFTQIMGYTREETVGRTSVELNIWKNSEDRKRLIDGLQQYGFVGNFEAEFVAKNGDIKNGLMSAKILEIRGENVIVSITRDYTDKKKMEQALAKSEAWHRSILETAMDGFILADTSGYILEVNKTYCKMTGYTEEELLKMNITNLVSNELELNVPDHFNKVIEQGEDLFDSRHLKKDGTSIDVEVSVQFRKDDGGRFVVFIKDITERKNWQEQLRKMQKMESIGNLAGGIAHDFNNILFPIIGMSELLMEDLTEDSFEYESAKEIYKAGNRAGDLVKQILAFSRQAEHKMMPVKFQKILKEVMRLCRSTIPSYIHINQDIQTDCGFVWANGTQLHQIGMNLITNAYHAVEDKNGEITVKLEEVRIETHDMTKTNIEAGHYVKFSVSDNGTGIDPNIRDKIFDPYFTTKSPSKGTGLGLAVTYGIVKKHGGEINVKSQTGKGSTFDVYLPKMKESVNDDLLNAENAVLKRGNEHILLVDDEPSVTKLEKQMLERLGYKVTFCLDSLQALKIFSAAPDRFDLVISDMSMPGMTGDILAAELKKVRPSIPIIICTGFSERINKERAESIGVNGFLMKPIIRSDMAEMMRKIVDESLKIKENPDAGAGFS